MGMPFLQTPPADTPPVTDQGWPDRLSTCSKKEFALLLHHLLGNTACSLLIVYSQHERMCLFALTFLPQVAQWPKDTTLQQLRIIDCVQ